MCLRSKLGLALLLAVMVGGCSGDPDVRPFPATGEQSWLGHAVSYGPHRDGQRPGDASPTTAEIREDLHLMAPHWKMLRLYGSTGVAEDVLTIIRTDKIDLKVMLGVWIAVQDANNPPEVAAAIRLANAYPDIVIAVSVGNETQVSWSAHRSSLDTLIGHVRTVRAAVQVPVTVADDFNFWNKPESQTLAPELDFITMHAHPMWNGTQIDQALPWVKEQWAEVQALHPDRRLVLGETGWATTVHDQGEQAKLIKGAPGENEQEVFYDEIRAWAETEKLTVFFFEAFDENWKGGEHPNEVEKHWGVFNTDRTAKQAVR